MHDDEQMRREFVEDMEAIDSSVSGDYLEALVVAMDKVSSKPTRKKNRAEAVYFGAIGEGVFFADGDPENARWYRDCVPAEAISRIRYDMGDIADELEDRLLSA